MRKATFAREIEEFAGDEPIEAVAVSRYRREDYSHEGPEPYTDHTLGTGPVAWEVARPVLDYRYDAGYGGQDCHNVFVWTPTRVISVHEYDGATWLISVPRNPTNCNAAAHDPF